jgi:hypothetical protein
MSKKFLLFFGLIILLADIAVAQTFYSRSRNRQWAISAGMGIGSYYGDLNNPGDIIDFTPDANFGIRYRLNNRISVGGNFGWFMLRGDDNEADGPGRKIRNLSFTSHNFEGMLFLSVDAYPVGNRFYQRPLVNPFTYVGIGLTYFNPRAKLDGEWHALRPLQTEGVAYSPITPIIPIGLGLKFRASPFLNIILEGGYRITFTDYIDDVSNVYPDPSSLGSDLARELSIRSDELDPPVFQEVGDIRGNPTNNDGYFLATIKVEYFLGGSLFGRDPYNRGMRGRRRR